MNLFGVMDVSASALKAERVRAEVVAANMANAESTRTEDGGPYQRRHVQHPPKHLRNKIRVYRATTLVSMQCQ